MKALPADRYSSEVCRRLIQQSGPRRWKLAQAFVLAPVLLLLLAGCLRYDMTMQNGDVIRSRTKPKLNEHGAYVYKDLAGKEKEIPSMRIRQIEAVRAGSQPSRPF
jgi:hypothetical protein